MRIVKSFKSYAMLRMCQLYISLVCIINFSFAQKNYNTNPSDTTNIFLKGVQIKNLSILIPWGASFSEIKEYGNPKITSLSKTTTLVSWDSVIILNGVSANLTYIYSKPIIQKKDFDKVRTLTAWIHSYDVEKIKSYFINYTELQGELKGNKNHYFYAWPIDTCYVRLGYQKKHGHYIAVQKL